MLRNTFLFFIIVVSATNAIFFGGSGSCCCQPSCGCAAQVPPSCPCQASPCGQSQLTPQGYAQPPPFQPPQGYAQPPPFQTPQGYAQPPPFQLPQGYAQPPLFQPPQGYAQPSQGVFSQPTSSQPRHIVVRPADSVSHPVGPQSPVSSANPSYQSGSQESQQPPPPSSSDNYKTGNSAPYKSARASKTVLVDARCNSAELRQVLDENIVADDANESKRRVHKAANEQFTTSDDSALGIDVICAPGAFSYRIATDFFCEHAKGNITCFAYQQHST